MTQGASPQTVLILGPHAMEIARVLTPLQAAGMITWVLDPKSTPTPRQWYSADVVITEEPRLEDLMHWQKLRVQPVLVLCRSRPVPVRVAYLDAGALDCLTFPFHRLEMLARVRALLRQASPLALRDGPVTLNLARQQVLLSGQPVAVTEMEFSLLLYLLTHPNRACPRQELLRLVWGKQHDITTRTVDTHINQLRHKLVGLQIDGVYGVGYRYLPAEA